jgi:predicted alpha/beta hydrolase family esterase
MNNAILIPGRPDKIEHYDPSLPANSDDHWFPWLSRQFILKDIHAVVVEPPMPFQPRYELWKKEFERFDISSNTIIVGHSCGGGFLIRWLSENKDFKVGKVVLVAPWINPENNPESDTADFFEFDIDPTFPARTAGVTVFSSDDDQETIQKSVSIIKDKVPDIKIVGFHNYGHFCYENMKTREFPELLEECLK